MEVLKVAQAPSAGLKLMPDMLEAKKVSKEPRFMGKRADAAYLYNKYVDTFEKR